MDGERDFRSGSLFRLFADRPTGGTSATAATADHVLRLGVVSLTVFLSTARIETSRSTNVNLAKTNSFTTDIGRKSSLVFFSVYLLPLPSASPSPLRHNRS